MGGTVINDRYSVVEEIGRGGQGVTLLAKDLARKGSAVVVKVYWTARVSDRAAWEFGQLARLDHDGIVAVHELGVVGSLTGALPTVEPGQGFVVQDWIDGVSSARLMDDARSRSGGWVRLLGELFAEMAESLAYLHERRLLHRDLKPGHVIVRRRRKLPRSVLIDFGLSLPVGDHGSGLTGTPGYIAPECVAGMYGPASDLYALGATAYRLATGVRPVRVQAGSARSVIEAMLRVRPRPVGELCPDLPLWLASTVDGLMSVDPADRPPSARALLEHLERHMGKARKRRGQGAVLGRGAARPPLRGRRQAVDMLVDAVARRLDDPSGPGEPVFLVEGPRGIGKSAIVAELKRRLLVERATAGRSLPRFVEGDLRELLHQADLHARELGSVSGWLDGTQPRGRAPVEGIVQALTHGSVVGHGAVLVLRDPDELSKKVIAGLAGRLSDADAPALQLAVVVERDTDQGGGFAGSLEGMDGIRVVRPGPLDAGHVADIARFVMGPQAGDDAVHLVVQRSAGNPLYAIEMSARLAMGELRRADRKLPSTLLGLVGQALSELPGPQVDALRVLVLGPAQTDVGFVAAVLEEPREAAYGRLEPLLERGWVEAAGEWLRPAPLVAQVMTSSLPDGQARAMHRRIAAAMQEAGRFMEWEIALARLRGGMGAKHAAAVLLGAARLSELGEPARAIPLVREAIRHLDDEPLHRASLDLARLYRETGMYDEALALLRTLPEGQERDLELARCLRLSGDPGAALPLLEALTAAGGEHGLGARALLARMHVDEGRARQAIDLLADLDGVPDDARTSVLEPLGMALASEGREQEALAAFSEGAGIAQRTGRALLAARFWSLQGRALQASGDYGGAHDAYDRALALARAGGDAHAQAVYSLNAGAVLTELGRYGDAAGKLNSAHQLLRELGEVRELPLAMFNIAVLRSRIGDSEGAQDMARKGAALARRRGQDHMVGYFLMVEGDAARSRGDMEGALGLHDSAFEAFERTGDRDGRIAALVSAAEVASMSNDAGSALPRLEAAKREKVATGEGLIDDRLSLASARVSPRQGPAREKALERLERARQRFLERGDTENALRSSWVMAGLLGSRDPRTTVLLGEAGKLATTLRRAAAGLGYNPLRSDPELRAIERMHMQNREPDSVTSSPSVQPPGAENKWKRLVRINKRLNSELRLRPLLETILDTLLDLTGATRGFILIKGTGGDLRVKAARNIDSAGLPGGKGDFSSSIVKEVMETGRPLITVDAASDMRFDALRSVHDLALKSVLCVPLSLRGEVAGAVYVDNPYSSAMFGGEDVELVMDFSDQASIALTNARLMVENRRRELSIERLNRKLEKALRRQQIELRGLRETIDRSLPATGGGARRYQEIVGESEPLTRLFRMLDRISDSDLPVVVTGESGTGKELVARAIHFNGPRRRGPFVSESCAAIPDTLLESVLFGHVKGAFTGADKDRPGLFEVASSGTLFLDEIAAMSQSMQTKLLRALQEGVIRPLGGSAEKKVDVRIIAAVNRDLETLVREGGFREDLFYRLNVVSVTLPPLRERSGDIPALVAHFLAKHAQGRSVRVTSGAMSRLMAHRWPGNVRELENEIMRALVLGGDEIDEQVVLPGKDLDEPAGSTETGGSLMMHEHVDMLERSLIRRALSRVGGNQSAAARLLGISRFGLIKKMKRLGI